MSFPPIMPGTLETNLIDCLFFSFFLLFFGCVIIYD